MASRADTGLAKRLPGRLGCEVVSGLLGFSGSGIRLLLASFISCFCP